MNCGVFGRSQVTRSVSEGVLYRPRPRFGLLWKSPSLAATCEGRATALIDSLVLLRDSFSILALGTDLLARRKGT
jgi:hypothetical protein